MRELTFKESMKVCQFCSKKKEELVKRNEQMDKEKNIECRKALERETIAKEKQYTKEDEIKLRQIQKLQMMEKEHIGQEQRTIDTMWHQMMLEELKHKKEEEEIEAQLSNQEMKKLRQFYDIQIATANRQRRIVLENEREIETRRLKEMRERMDEEYLEALKRKNQKMQENKKKFLQDHEIKSNRRKYEKEQERNEDLKMIQLSNEDILREKKNNYEKNRQLQKEKQIFMDNIQIERNMSDKLNKERELLLLDWRKEQDDKDFLQLTKLKEEKIRDKQKAQREYKQYVDRKLIELNKKRQIRNESMESVKRTAFLELQRNMNITNAELRKQNEYRRMLAQQIYENETVKKLEQSCLHQKQMPFARDTTFKDAMVNKLDKLYLETPEHPFAKLITSQNECRNIVHLPSLDKDIL